ncbi:DUF6676 family protein [Corynebacterium aquilae]|uniref:Rv1476 family membrane protein n=1 Tax=Corynebacterium aquilae TaxID=203263 RepID=UPI0009515490|nr:DUF6676 family protein [Corynebacterium aquilae]
MIPDYVNLDDLAQQVEADNVAIDGLEAAYPGTEAGLIDITNQARSTGVGDVKIVVLDRTPAQPADLRDIAYEIQQRTGADTVIVRSPGTGAVVSDQYSRKSIEQAEKAMYGNPDYISSTQAFLADVREDTTPWQEINLGIGVVVALTIVTTAWSTWRRRQSAAPQPAAPDQAVTQHSTI